MMVRLAHCAAAIIVLAVAGCGFDGASFASRDGGGEIDGALPGDTGTGSSDAISTDASCELLDFAVPNVPACSLPGPGLPIEIPEGGSFEIDTDTGTLTDVEENVPDLALPELLFPQDRGPELMVVVTELFTVGDGAELVVRGDRALVIISVGDIDIRGALRAAATGSSSGAAGDHDDNCATGRGQDGQEQEERPNEGSDLGGSGGGGGAFGDAGGPGSTIAKAANGYDPTPGGVAATDVDLMPLRGGCRGGAGADRQDNGGGGLGGGGGGALQLVAGQKITVSGVVTVSGGGGRGVSNDASGGGGGGSGGGLLLVANTIEVTSSGALTANGGGGGEGGRQTSSTTAGQNGRHADSEPAVGGSGSSSGGNGGNGGAGTSGATAAEQGNSFGSTASGGGGGGGAVGVIQLHAAQTLDVDTDGGAVVSPPVP